MQMDITRLLDRNNRTASLAYLAGLGFKDTLKAIANIEALSEGVNNPLFIEVLPVLVKTCSSSSNPDDCLNNFERVSAACKDRGAFLEIILTNPDAARTLAPVLAASRFLTRFVTGDPEGLIAWLFAEGQLSRPKERDGLLRECIEYCPPATPIEEAVARLRGFKYGEFLRITARDLSGLAGLVETTLELSNLADAALETALRVSVHKLEKKYGHPQYAPSEGRKKRCPFTVIAMGKLGGRELNFSSDIDIMYLYLTDKGETSGPQKITNHQYFVKVGELINRLIGQKTEDGFVFRVDLRLRPEGERGDLVQSLAGYELYYESWGQTWERSALLKARPCAGDMELGRVFLETIRPFVFRKYLDYSAISEIRDMKQRVEKHALTHGQDLIDLKLGAGGIREIEFFISVLQLIYGAREQGVREKSSLKALHRLALKNLISFEEQQDLAKAYEFLRTAEHRLQVVDERQTHSLNNTMEEVQPLAMRLGFRDKDGLTAGEAFTVELTKHNNRVRQIYDGLLTEQAVDVIDTDGGFSPLFEIDIPEDECVRLLGKKGFNDPRQSYINFLLLRDGSPGSPLTPRSRGLFIKIMPALLYGCAQSPDPDMALARLESFVAAFGSREALYDFISTQPEAARRVTRLLGWSDYFSRLLITYPELSDSLLFAGDEASRKTRDEMSGELEKELAKFATLADKMDILRKYKHAEELRIGIDDILNDPGTKTTSHTLTTLAEVVLEKTLLLAAEDTDSKYGKPSGVNKSAGIAVAGFGKLGSGELGYGSDLDIIFLYRGSETGGKSKGIGLTEYYARLSERAIFILTSLTREGFLFRVDTRLRPGGTKGVLAHNIESLREYYMKKASVWELQALTRARGVAGDGRLISLFEKMREEILLAPKDAGDVKAAVKAMRARIERELGKKVKGGYHIKYGKGGLVDIEFMIQCLQLIRGPENPDVLTSDTQSALDAITGLGLLPGGEKLKDSYVFLRDLESCLRITSSQAETVLPEDPARLTVIAARMGYGKSAGAGKKLLDDYLKHTGNVRQIYEGFFS